MPQVVLYHNPRCSKSRQTLQLLEAKGISPEIIDYLDQPPTTATLKKILGLLGLEAIDLVRRHEAPFKELGLGRDSDPEQLLAAIHAHPILLQRPIVVVDDCRAAIGRPPENIEAIL